MNPCEAYIHRDSTYVDLVSKAGEEWIRMSRKQLFDVGETAYLKHLWLSFDDLPVG